MRRKELETLSKDVRGVRLKRSELRDVFEIVSVVGEESVTIETPTHVFDDIEELVRSRAPTTEIKIRAYRKGLSARGLSFTLKVFVAEVYAFSPDNETLGVASKLTEYLTTRRRFLPRWRGNFWASIFVSTLFTIFGLSVMNHFGVQLALQLPLFLVISFVTGSTLSASPFEKMVVFSPEDDERKPINWRSAGWDVFKLFLGATIAVAIGKLLGYKR
jgi:hypothetical protein